MAVLAGSGADLISIIGKVIVLDGSIHANKRNNEMIIRILVISVLGFLGFAVFASDAVNDGFSTVYSDELLMADNRRKGRRDDRQEDRDDKQDCRQEEGRVGDDKRECKQEDRAEGDEGAEEQEGAEEEEGAES